MLDLCLKNCKLSPGYSECSIGIHEGKIVSISKLEPYADEKLDLKGNLVLPGLIDAHVHLRDPGMTYKEDFNTGTMAAAAGGFTTVLDMPNTDPPTNTANNFRQKLKIARRKSIVDFGLHAGISDLDEIGSLSKLSPASFKIFMDLYDHAFLIEAFEKINGVCEEAIISLHPEDHTITQQCTEKLKEKRLTPETYALARPPLAEEVAVGVAISLSQKFEQKVHLCHTSTILALKMVEQARKSGTNITTEATPHHIFLDTSYLKQYGTLAKTNPPLRNKKDGISPLDISSIDIMATDHAPHTLKEKEEDIWNAPPGVPGLEIVLPLLLTQINQGTISIDTLKSLLCENPAKIFNLKNKGHIQEGMDADLVVVDLKKEGRIDPSNFYSKAHYTPFEDFKVKGMPIMTMVRGNLIMKDGNLYKNKGNHVYD